MLDDTRTTDAPAPVPGSLVPIDVRPRADPRAALVAELRAAGGCRELATFDPAEPDGAMAAALVEVTEQLGLNDLAPITLAVVHVAIREGEQLNRSSGEISGMLRSVFVDDQGQAYATNSPVVARFTLALLASPVGRARIEPPLHVRFSRVRTSSGGNALTASVDPAEFKTAVERTARRR